MSEDVRPFEEYKEMIKDMRREEMIKGLYDLSARITKQDKEIERLKTLWEADRQNWACIMYEKEKEIDKLKNNKPDLTNFIKLETAKLNRKGEQEKNRLYSENLLLKNDVEGLNNIINELKEWFKGYHKSYASCKWYEEDYIEFIEHLENEIKEGEKKQ